MVYYRRRSWRHQRSGSPRYQLIRQDQFFHKDVENDVENLGREIGDKISREIKAVQVPNFKIPSEAIQKLADKIISGMTQETLNKIAKYSNRVFVDVRDELFKRYGFKISKDTMWKYLVKDLTQRVVSLAKDSMVELKSEQMDNIAQQFENPEREVSFDDTINDIIDTTKANSGMVARTLESSLYNEAKRRGYEIIEADLGMQPEEAKYVWVNPLDHRTTKTCQSIVERTKDGVSMKKMIEIIKEESRKEFPDYWKEDNPTSAHYQCRSSFYLQSE